MPKGIKKIKFVPQPNEANNSNSILDPLGNWFVVPANKKAHFYIKEWHKDTTDVQKKGSLYWMVLDKDRKKIIHRLQCMTDKYFSFRIEKALCGYSYYIEASMSGKPDSNFTGVFLAGKCDPLLVSSTWSRTRGGKNIKNTDDNNYGLCYGEVVHFHADTEGINGEIVTVEVHNEMWNGDYKMRTLYNVTVTDGQINLKIPNTSEWKGSIKFIQENEEFFVKIKRKNGTFLKDKNGKDEHGKYLNIKNVLKTVNKAKPSNQVSLITGAPDKNIKKVGSCKFLKIKVSDVDDFFVFEEGKTKVKPTSTKPSEETHVVYFDFKKHEIRSDAQSKLKSLISLLMANSHGKIIIDAHADERGADNFNMKLSQDRAESVMNFLKNNGLGKSKFEPHGHGENQLIVKGTNLTEAQHQKNRRATIRFNYYDTTLAPIVYETIVPTAKKPRNITVSAITRESKGCRYPKGEHKTIMIKGNGKEIKKQGDSLVQPVHSIIGDDFVKNYLIYFGKYINYFSTIHNNYYAYINSCTYYPQKENPTLHIKAYPDIVWLAHGKYDYDEDYFFHNHSLSLQKGFAPEFSAVLDEIYSYTQYLGLGNYLTKDILLAYIKKEAEKLEIGLHAIHDRTLEKKGAALSLTGTTVDFIKETRYTKYATSAAMYGFVCLQIILEILILILTRGRSGITKIKKLNKIAKHLKKVKVLMDKLPEDVEIVGPSIAYRSGLYYYKQADSRMALVWECDIKIEPLIAIKYEFKKDLLDYISDEALKGKLSKLSEQRKKDYEKVRDKAKDTYEDKLTNISFSLSVIGGLSVETNVKYNFLTKSYTFAKQAGNFYDETRGLVAFGQYVKGKAEIKSIFYKEIFSFSPLRTEVKLEAKFEIDCSFGIVQQYGKDKDGFFVENYLYFSGLKGKYKFKSEVKNQELGVDWEASSETDKDKEDKSFIILNQKTITLYKIYLLKS